MSLQELKSIRVETGMSFGQECYLDPSRAQEFLKKINTIRPNFFTRSNFQHLPQRFSLENFDGHKICTVRLNSFNYTVHGPVENNDFQNDAAEFFNCFCDLFHVRDVRRIGKICDLPFPKSLKRGSLNELVKIQEPVKVNGLNLLFRKEGKNINLHFLPLLPLKQRITPDDWRSVEAESETIVRCDINNIDMSSPLDISVSLREIFEFADCYVRDDFVKFLDKYFGGSCD